MTATKKKKTNNNNNNNNNNTMIKLKTSLALGQAPSRAMSQHLPSSQGSASPLG